MVTVVSCFNKIFGANIHSRLKYEFFLLMSFGSLHTKEASELCII